MSLEENVTVGDIETNHQLLEVKLVQKESGYLIYEDYMEFGENKHTLNYEYDVNFSSDYTMEEKELVVFTNNTSVSIVSYDNVMITKSSQTVNVEIGLNPEHTHTKDEVITFNLVFNVTGNELTEESYEKPSQPIPQNVVYNMNYTPANSITFDDLPLEFYSVTLADGKVIFDNSSDKIIYNVGIGTVEIDLGSYEDGKQTRGVVLLNGQEISDESNFNSWTVSVNVLENNSVIEIKREQYNTNDMYVEEIRFIE